MAKAWAKDMALQIEDGNIVEAPAPCIISASRSTDIPAFYADWFFHRLKQGYSVWRNPFNGVDSYISYKMPHSLCFGLKIPNHFSNICLTLKSVVLNTTYNTRLTTTLTSGLNPVSLRFKSVSTPSNALLTTEVWVV